MNSDFPADILLSSPDRRKKLVQEFYESHHASHPSKYVVAIDGDKKADFFKRELADLGANRSLSGIDIGCRGGILACELREYASWVGCDLDRRAIDLAIQKGIPCVESDVSVALDFASKSFDVVMMTEVLEHLPYPTISLDEVSRILKPGGIFLGSVPLEYNLNRRWRVMRGKRLEHDPTHLHHFSFEELNELLSDRFEKVKFCPLRGLPAKYSFARGKWANSLIRDIAWIAVLKR